MRLYNFYGEVVCEDHLYGTVNPAEDEVTDPAAECHVCGAKAGKSEAP